MTIVSTRSIITPFDVFLEFVWRPENDGKHLDAALGETFATVRGVTAKTWNDAAFARIVPSTVPIMDATNDQLIKVLRWCCWQRCWCDNLVSGGAPGIAVVVANMAMVAGSGAAVRELQRLLPREIIVDGVMGPHTASSIISTNHIEHDLTKKLTDAYISYFSTLKHAPEFLRGWTRRARECEDVAHTLG